MDTGDLVSDLPINSPIDQLSSESLLPLFGLSNFPLGFRTQTLDFEIIDSRKVL